MKSNSIDEVLAELNAEFDKATLDWLISMYDGAEYELSGVRL